MDGSRHESCASRVREMKPRVPFIRYRESVPAEWIDHNGHMNVAYYVLAFDRATDCFFDYLGLGADYTRGGVGSVFIVDMNVSYRQELHEGDAFEVATQLLGFDEKRLHFFHEMSRNGGEPTATNELLALHVDQKQRRASPIPEDAATLLESLSLVHGKLPLPNGVGRSIGLPGGASKDASARMRPSR